MALTDPDRTKLVKLLGMLNSCFDGERATAGALVDRFIRERQLTWDQIIPCAEQRQQTPPTLRRAWHDVIVECRDNLELLDDWEIEFLNSLTVWRGRLTPKQQAKLAAIAERLGVELAS